MPAAMTSETALPADSVESKRRKERPHRFRLAQEPQRHLGHHRQRAFRPDHHPEQVESWRVKRHPAHVNQLAVRKDGFQPQHVVHREPVLEAVRAARVLGDVAADRADHLARRVGGIVVAERRDLAADLEVHDARLYRDALVRNVDVENPVEPSEDDQHAVWDGQRAARKTGSMPTRDERHARPMAEPHDLLDFRSGIWQHRDCGLRSEPGQRVGFIGEQLRGIAHDPVVTDNPLEFSKKGLVQEFSRHSPPSACPHP